MIKKIIDYMERIEQFVINKNLEEAFAYKINCVLKCYRFKFS